MKDDDETETAKGVDDIGVSARTRAFSRKDALNAVTILQTIFMQTSRIPHLVFYEN